MKTRRIPFLIRVLSQYNNKFGYDYYLDKHRDDFGRIEFDNGVRHYISRADIRVNQVGPHEIVKDKFQTDQFLHEYGYPTVPSRLFYSENFRSLYMAHCDGLEDALSYGRSLNFPLIVKPNNGLHGNYVHKVSNEKQLKRALLKTFRSYDKVLVQQFAKGHDYRIIVYRNNFISAYRRIPLTLIGDGKRSILTMLEDKIVEAEQEDRSIHFDLDTIKIVLKRKRMRLNTVLKEKESVRLLDNANLSTGGTAEDVTNEIHKDYVDTAINASQDLHLNLSGVDLMIQGDITKKPEDNHWFFLELNSSPGFDWYSRIGNEQEERIHSLFKIILGDLRNGDYLCP